MKQRNTKVIQDLSRVFHLVDTDTGETLVTVNGSSKDTVQSITEFFKK